jgi:hypothetical protein
VSEGQTTASEKAGYEIAAAVRKMLRVADDHLAKLFEKPIREFHGRLIYTRLLSLPRQFAENSRISVYGCA